MTEVSVYVDTPEWFYSKRSTDWALKQTLVRELRELGFRMLPSVLYGIAYNLQYLLPRFFPVCMRGGIAGLCVKMRELLLRRNKVRYLVAQGGRPPCPPGCAVLWETYFLPPQSEEVEGRRSDEFCRGGKDRWIQSMEEFGPKVRLIAVRGSVSVDLVKKMYPEWAEKVVDLPFVQPEYAIIGEEDVRRKQSLECVEIVFLGRQAKRKGLDKAVEALCLLRKRGVTNFRFTVVSTMQDGAVELPNEGWVDYRPEVAHDEAMEIFRQAQIFIMPSRFESYGLVYLEAMASGCVVAVRDGEPQREFVDYGKAGLCVDVDNIEDIANKLQTVLVDKELRCNMAINAVRRYKLNFSQHVIRDKWMSAIKRLTA